MLWIISPAPASSTTARPTSKATNAPSARWRPPPAAARAFFQRLMGVHVGTVECGREPEEHAGENRNGERKEPDVRIEPDGLRARHRVRKRGQHQSRTPKCEQQAERSGAGSEEHTLRQKLPDHAFPVRAQRHPDGKFAPPAGSAGKQQVGDIGAGDDQHEPTAPSNSSNVLRPWAMVSSFILSQRRIRARGLSSGTVQRAGG